MCVCHICCVTKQHQKWSRPSRSRANYLLAKLTHKLYTLPPFAPFIPLHWLLIHSARQVICIENRFVSSPPVVYLSPYRRIIHRRLQYGIAMSATHTHRMRELSVCVCLCVQQLSMQLTRNLRESLKLKQLVVPPG